ncbi:hypothetical protein BN871_GR_00110 [Paenibacillus sp. P22]|nr:hypothetical protein BN871_GR_00110 [Paenibacillus sp. P22]
MRIDPSGSASRPDFKRANIMAEQILRELNNPEPSIDPFFIATKFGWKVIFEPLYGPDAYTAKDVRKGKSRYIIFIADDAARGHSPLKQRRRQRYTLAHEIGHIMLHSEYDWASSSDIPEFGRKLEVEAHWFASRLLMPDYGFQNVMDLTVKAVTEKFDVNISAARKRLEKLDERIRNNLTEEVALFFNWQKPQILLDEPMPDEDIWLMEVAAGAEMDVEFRVCSNCQEIMLRDLYGYICFKCGQYDT